MVTVKAPTNRHHHQGVPLKSAKDRMDIISAYQQLGSYRAAADECGTTHRTVKKVVDRFEADQAGVLLPRRVARAQQLRRGGPVGRRTRREVTCPDLGQAAAAGREGRRLRGLGT